MIHRRENKKNSIKPLRTSGSVSTRVRNIKETKTQVLVLELLKSFILYCKYFGRLKIPDGVIFNVLFLDGDTFLSEISIVRICFLQAK